MVSVPPGTWHCCHMAEKRSPELDTVQNQPLILPTAPKSDFIFFFLLPGVRG